MRNKLSQRLQNLHNHSGDPDTVAEAALTIESLESMCESMLANIHTLAAIVDVSIGQVEMLEELCIEQAREIRRLGGRTKVDMTTLTDEQTARILKAIMEARP